MYIRSPPFSAYNLIMTFPLPLKESLPSLLGYAQPGPDYFSFVLQNQHPHPELDSLMGFWSVPLVYYLREVTITGQCLPSAMKTSYLQVPLSAYLSFSSTLSLAKRLLFWKSYAESFNYAILQAERVPCSFPFQLFITFDSCLVHLCTCLSNVWFP